MPSTESSTYLQERLEKDLGGEVFEDAFFTDAMLEAELLPELHADLIATLSHLERDDFSRHFPSVSGECSRVSI